jgi:DNA repair protein RecO
MPEVFELLLSFLNHLEICAVPEALRASFELRLLQKSGFSTSLEQCFLCRTAIQPAEASFSPSGGVLCRECQRRRDETTFPISAGALSFMRKSITLPENRVRRLRIDQSLLEEVLKMLDMIFEEVLELRPQSTDFQKKIRAAYRPEKSGSKPLRGRGNHPGKGRLHPR